MATMAASSHAHAQAQAQAQAQTQAQGQSHPDKTVTGYPVTYASAAPPPQPQQHVDPIYYPNYPDRRSKSTLLCRLIVFAVAFLYVIASVSFIMWLIFQPLLPEFRVDSASISQLNTTESKSSLTATWKFSLTVRNPNRKLTMSYNSLQASVLYGMSELGRTQLAPFWQDKGNETRVQFQLGVVSEYVGESVVSGIESDKKARAEVGFGVRVDGWVRFKSGWWEMRWRFMKVSCEGVNFGFSKNGGSEGSLVGRLDPCRVAM